MAFLICLTNRVEIDSMSDIFKPIPAKSRA